MFIGSIGIGAGGLATGPMAAAGVAPALAPATSTTAGPAGLGTLRLDSLASLLTAYTTAEILLALLLATARERPRQAGCGLGGFELLAGLALASQLARAAGGLGIACVHGPGAGPGPSPVGALLDVTA